MVGTTVFHIVLPLDDFPTGLTHQEHHQHNIGFSCCLLMVNQVDAIDFLIEMVCPSLLSSFKSRSTDCWFFRCGSVLNANDGIVNVVND